MDRVIKMADLRQAVVDAYEKFKSLDQGNIDPRVTPQNDDAFAISVALPDGTVINKGDATMTFPMGEISRISPMSLRLEQKAAAKAACGCKGGDDKCKEEKTCGCKPKMGCDAMDLPFCPQGVKLISKLQPQGDPDSKWNFIENRFIGLIGSAPQLDDKLYEQLKKQAADADVAKKLADADIKLEDDAAQSIDLYLRAMSMTVNAQQLAEMGATIAADGVNPFTRQIVFDGVFSQQLVARLALKSHRLRRFIMKTGLPAIAGFGGGIVGVMPGVMAIAAYSPRLCGNGASVKAAKAIKYIMETLQLSVFASAKVVIEQ